MSSFEVVAVLLRQLVLLKLLGTFEVFCKKFEEQREGRVMEVMNLQ